MEKATERNRIRYKNLTIVQHHRLKSFNKGFCIGNSDTVYVSPAIFSLLHSDFEITFDNLEVVEVPDTGDEDIERAIDNHLHATTKEGPYSDFWNALDGRISLYEFDKLEVFGCPQTLAESDQSQIYDMLRKELFRHFNKIGAEAVFWLYSADPFASGRYVAWWFTSYNKSSFQTAWMSLLSVALEEKLNFYHEFQLPNPEMELFFQADLLLPEDPHGIEIFDRSSVNIS